MRANLLLLASLSLVAAAASFGAAGCASVRSGDGGEIAVVANGEASSMRIEGDRAWGPLAELKRTDGTYRGVLGGHVVDLEFASDHIKGTVGASKVDIQVSLVEGRVHGEGTLNGRASTFDVDDGAIAGSFGYCDYDMKRKADTDAYVGYRSCSGTASSPSRVTIPDFIRSLPAVDQATLYTLMLTS